MLTLETMGAALRIVTLRLSGVPDCSSSVGVTVQVTSSPLLKAPERLGPEPREVPLASVHSMAENNFLEDFVKARPVRDSRGGER